MSARSIFTRRRFGIDINVLLVMLLVVVLCGGLVSYELIGKKTCTSFNLVATGYNNQKNGIFTAGESVILTSSLSLGSNLIWDFGDGTPTLDGYKPIHIFLKTGNFVITATENGRCTQTISITVKAKKVDAHTEIIPLETITGNMSPMAGVEEKYQCNLKASSYEWSVANSNNYETIKAISASYKFQLPGTYELQVKLDNDPSKVYTKQIYVLAAPKPAATPQRDAVIPRLIPSQPQIHPTTPIDNPVIVPQKQPDAPTVEVTETNKTKLIADDAFKIMLEDLIQNDKKIADFMPYLYYGINTKVYENGKKQPVDFLTLCQHLQNSTKNEIKLLILHREESKNVQNIEIKFKKKGWLLF